MGRFISEDPIGLEGGDVNYYAYVTNNPVNWADPFGLQRAKVIECRGGIPGLPPGSGTICCDGGKMAICIPEKMESPYRECLIQHEQTHYEEAKTKSCTGNPCERAGAPPGTFGDECRASQVQYECLKELGGSCEFVRDYAEKNGCDTAGDKWKKKPAPPKQKPRKKGGSNDGCSVAAVAPSGRHQ